jgi:hypothetical protein
MSFIAELIGIGVLITFVGFGVKYFLKDVIKGSRKKK